MVEDIKIADAIMTNSLSSYDSETLEMKCTIKELEYKNSVLWRWCLINSILLIVFVVLMMTY